MLLLDWSKFNWLADLTKRFMGWQIWDTPHIPLHTYKHARIPQSNIYHTCINVCLLVVILIHIYLVTPMATQCTCLWAGHVVLKFSYSHLKPQAFLPQFPFHLGAFQLIGKSKLYFHTSRILQKSLLIHCV